MKRPALTAVTYLAPIMLPGYRAIIEHISAEIGQPITLREGSADYHEAPDADLMFICGLPYIKRSQVIEAIAAPILIGERYGGKPIYFSDVIVRHDSPYHTFEDLRGKRWAYNEPESQSGYGITRYTLLQRKLTDGFFGEIIEAGFHQKCIRMVILGQADAAAIDSHVLSLEYARHPHLAHQLRVIDSFGPSTIQPVAVNRRLPDGLRQDIQQGFVKLYMIPSDVLAQGLTSQYVPVGDSDYDDIRAMLDACQEANFLTLK
jgi:phosphonate transport system substrate-binding protein